MEENIKPGNIDGFIENLSLSLFFSGRIWYDTTDGRAYDSTGYVAIRTTSKAPLPFNLTQLWPLSGTRVHSLLTLVSITAETIKDRS